MYLYIYILKNNIANQVTIQDWERGLCHLPRSPCMFLIQFPPFPTPPPEIITVVHVTKELSLLCYFILINSDFKVSVASDCCAA